MHPHLEYISPNCLLYLEGDIKHLERLQQLSTGMMSGFKGLTTGDVACQSEKPPTSQLA